MASKLFGKPVKWKNEDKKWWECYKCSGKNLKSKKKCKDCHHRGKPQKDRECSPPPVEIDPNKLEVYKREPRGASPMTIEKINASPSANRKRYSASGENIDKTLRKDSIKFDSKAPGDINVIIPVVKVNNQTEKTAGLNDTDNLDNVAGGTNVEKLSKVWRCKVCHFDNENEETPHCDMCLSVKPNAELCFKPYVGSELKESYQKDKKKRKKLSRSMLTNHMQSVLKKEKRKIEEKNALKTWRNIVEYCKRNNTHYTDNSFPDKDDQVASRNTVWKRITEISIDDDTQGPWTVYRDDISTADVAQGELEDCWLASAIALLAKRDHSSLLEKIIINKGYCEQGVYCLRLCKDGIWKIIFVDDRFPCYSQTGKLKYVKPKGKQLWVALIEKAAAKLYGGYQTLVAGLIVEAMAMLTGEPCEYVELQAREDRFLKVDAEDIWTKLKHGQDNGYLMGVTTPSTLTETDTGLFPLHAYPVLDVQENQSQRLITLKSIWEEHPICNGCLKNSALDEHDELVDKLKLDTRAGEFYVTFTEFMKHFSTLGICKVRRNWNETRLKGIFPTRTDVPLKYFRFTVLNDSTDVHFGLFQKNMRGQPLDAREHFVDMMIVVLKDQSDPPYSSEPLFSRAVAYSERLARGFVSCEVKLKPGMYTVACLSLINMDSSEHTEDTDLNKDFALVMHSSTALYIDEVDLTQYPVLKYAAADALILLAKQLVMESSGNHVDRRITKLSDEICTYSLVWWGEIIVLENPTNESIYYSRDYSHSSYIKGSRGDLITRDIIHSKKSQIINVATAFESTLEWRTVAQKGFKIIKSEDTFNLPKITSGLEGLHSERPIPEV